MKSRVRFALTHELRRHHDAWTKQHERRETERQPRRDTLDFFDHRFRALAFQRLEIAVGRLRISALFVVRQRQVFRPQHQVTAHTHEIDTKDDPLPGGDRRFFVGALPRVRLAYEPRNIRVSGPRAFRGASVAAGTVSEAGGTSITSVTVSVTATSFRAISNARSSAS